MYSTRKKKKSLLFRNLKKRYHFRVQEEVSLHDRVFFKISKARIYILGILLIVLLIGITTLLIAFTDLRKLIPGYADSGMHSTFYEMNRKVDSLEYICDVQSAYIGNLRNILTGNIVQEVDSSLESKPIAKENIQYTTSREDSLLRSEIEAIKDYTLQDRIFENKPSAFAGENFIIPIIGGVPTNKFSRVDRHYGIDLVGKSGDPVLSTLDGTVIFNEWTVETGHVLVIQHKNDLISVYKHNSSLLKKAGDSVKAGDPIAIIGNSGDLTSGTHLHFELWYKGIPLNPEDYLIL